MSGGPLGAPLPEPIASSGNHAAADVTQRMSGNSNRESNAPSQPRMTVGRAPARVRQAHVEWVRERLSDRDRAIFGSVGLTRLMTGAQLERLHFHDIAAPSRARVRRRVLARLVAWRVLVPLERRIGGARAGSAGLVFALDSCGQQLLAPDGTARRPTTPGIRFVSHILSVAELYVELAEAARSGDFELADFMTEPAAWVPNGIGGWLKPDGYLKLRTDTYDEHWWLEVDKATEHLPTLRRKFMSYLDFMQRGQLGPDNIMPRVLVTAPNPERLSAIREVIDALPSPGYELLHAALEIAAVPYLIQVLRE